MPPFNRSQLDQSPPFRKQGWAIVETICQTPGNRTRRQDAPGANPVVSLIFERPPGLTYSLLEYGSRKQRVLTTDDDDDKHAPGPGAQPQTAPLDQTIIDDVSIRSNPHPSMMERTASQEGGHLRRQKSAVRLCWDKTSLEQFEVPRGSLVQLLGIPDTQNGSAHRWPDRSTRG